MITKKVHFFNNLQHGFEAYSKYAQPNFTGGTIALFQIEKWIYDARLFTNSLSLVDITSTYKKYQTEKMGFQTFQAFLKELCASKNMDYEDFVEHLLDSPGPKTFRKVRKKRKSSNREDSRGTMVGYPLSNGNRTETIRERRQNAFLHTHLLEEIFKMYAKYGNFHSDGSTITLPQIDKWFGDAEIIDQDVTIADTGIIFERFKTISIDFETFLQFVSDLCDYKSLRLKDFVGKLKDCAALKRATVNEIRRSDEFDRPTDNMKYTGSHKQRFVVPGARVIEGRAGFSLSGPSGNRNYGTNDKKFRRK